MNSRLLALFIFALPVFLGNITFAQSSFNPCKNGAQKGEEFEFQRLITQQMIQGEERINVLKFIREGFVISDSLSKVMTEEQNKNQVGNSYAFMLLLNEDGSVHDFLNCGSRVSFSKSTLESLVSEIEMQLGQFEVFMYQGREQPKKTRSLIMARNLFFNN